MYGKLIGITFLASAMLLSTKAVTQAADTLLPGKRLIITNPRSGDEKRNRIMVTARTGTVGISPPGSSGDPTCEGAGGGGGRLTFTSAATGESHTTPLPCHNWTGRKSGSWRYNDRALADSTCKRVEIRSNRSVKAICLGRGPSVLDFELQPGASQQPINVTLEVGTGPDRYCLTFGGIVNLDGSNGKKFFARDSTPPVACAS